jgi:hypothetical protein
MIEVVDLPFSPWGEGGPKGRMRGRYGTPENNLWHIQIICCIRAWPPHPPAGTFSPLGRRDSRRRRHDL